MPAFALSCRSARNKVNGQISVAEEISVEVPLRNRRKYRNVVATRRGPPEVLEIVENDLCPPLPGEVRIRILACCVCLPDIQARYGQSPFAPRIPFVPGYAIVGVLDALGEGVYNFAVGGWIPALTICGAMPNTSISLND
jgi:hypothetical protein